VGLVSCAGGDHVTGGGSVIGGGGQRFWRRRRIRLCLIRWAGAAGVT
jgi:hypothetical protein